MTLFIIVSRPTICSKFLNRFRSFSYALWIRLFADHYARFLTLLLTNLLTYSFSYYA